MVYRATNHGLGLAMQRQERNWSGLEFSDPALGLFGLARPDEGAWRESVEKRVRGLGLAPRPVTTPEGETYHSVFGFENGRGYMDDPEQLANLAKALPLGIERRDTPAARAAMGQYYGGTREIVLSQDIRPEAVLGHELGHAIDDYSSRDVNAAREGLMDEQMIFSQQNLPAMVRWISDQTGAKLDDASIETGLRELYEFALLSDQAKLDDPNRSNAHGKWSAGALLRGEIPPPPDTSRAERSNHASRLNEITASAFDGYMADPEIFKRRYPLGARLLRELYNPRLKGFLTLAKADESDERRTAAYG